MSFAVPGITHCSIHHFETLDDHMRCAKCEAEKKEKELNEQKIRELKLQRLLSFSDEELEALKVLAKDKAKEIKKQRIRSEIKKLESELEE